MKPISKWHPGLDPEPFLNDIFFMSQEQI